MAKNKHKPTDEIGNKEDLNAQTEELKAEEYESAFGESMAKTIDLDTWHKGEDMA